MSAEAMSSEQQAAMAPVLGRIPSGVFVLIAGNTAGATTGMLASWVQQAGFQPPQVTVAVNKSRYLNDWLRDGACVTLNQVAKGDSALFRQFGKGFEPGADAFAGVETGAGHNGLPILPSALSSLEGFISGRMETSDHVVYLVTLTDAHSHRSAADAEAFVHIRRNGFTY